MLNIKICVSIISAGSWRLWTEPGAAEGSVGSLGHHGSPHVYIRWPLCISIIPAGSWRLWPEPGAAEGVQLALWVIMAATMFISDDLYVYLSFQLVVGDYGLSLEQQKVQLALWVIMAAPMFISDDLRVMPSGSKNLLLNHFVRTVSQDSMGIQGKRIWEVTYVL